MTSTVDRPAVEAPVEQQGRMTHRQILSALSGMMLAMFVAFLSGTIVSNALPTIITDLRGSQSQYTWIVTATLLASTASTPIWGKLSDLFSKKLLLQLAIVIFIVGSMLAGLSQSVETLIAWRVLQGLGLGGLQALVQIAMAAMISPRERGRYSGLLGSVMAVSTVGGPLIGGLLVDTSWLGWRWCFYVVVPFAAGRPGAAAAHPAPAGDQAGGAHRLHGGGVPDRRCLHAAHLGHPGRQQLRLGLDRDGVYVGGGVLAIVAFLITETRAKEPIVPLRLFRDRTTTLAIAASAAIGVAMFGSTVFLGQYLQISRGYSPTAAGLLTVPMVGGILLSSTGVRAPHHADRALEALPRRRLAAGGHRVRPALHARPRDAHRADVRLPVRARRRHRGDHAEPRPRRAEHGGRQGPRRGQLGRGLLPQPRRHGRRLGAGCGALLPRRRPHRRRPGRRPGCGRGGVVRRRRPGEPGRRTRRHPDAHPHLLRRRDRAHLPVSAVVAVVAVVAIL